MKSSVRPNEEAFDPQAFLAKVADGQTLIDYSDRETVFAQGDCADSIFYIHKGKVKVAVLSNQGKEAVVAILGTGQFFGEGCLAGQTHRMASVTAITECTIARLEKRVVVKVLHDEPAFSTLFISYGEFRQRRKTGARHRQGQPRDARRDDRHDSVSR